MILAKATDDLCILKHIDHFWLSLGLIFDWNFALFIVPLSLKHFISLTSLLSYFPPSPWPLSFLAGSKFQSFLTRGITSTHTASFAICTQWLPVLHHHAMSPRDRTPGTSKTGIISFLPSPSTSSCCLINGTTLQSRTVWALEVFLHTSFSFFPWNSRAPATLAVLTLVHFLRCGIFLSARSLHSSSPAWS